MNESLFDHVPPLGFKSRLEVADIADYLADLGFQGSADDLINAVRCCDEFPECGHVLSYVEALHHG